MNTKINCNYIKHIIKTEKFCKILNHIIKSTTTRDTNNISQISINTSSTSEVHENNVLAEKFIKDIRTYICSHGKCLQHYNRSHRRISIYNWKKIQTLTANTNLITRTAIDILNTMTQDTKTSTYIESTSTAHQTKVNCIYCCNPKLKGIKHIHFIKDERDNNFNSNNTKTSQESIKEVFSKIDEKADNNTNKLLSKPSPNPPGNKIETNNSIRMTYGDINYLGNNKALLYFNRGTRGTQTFTNSMQPLKKQPKFKDIIVLDDIVFTSTCKCDSILQHQEMFPHYRVTCAVGLTCPSRLNNIEKEIYKRSRNAPTEMFTKASSMLIRYW